ncbi:hypothetical protein [Clostridium thermobutyricum]|uniref:hypothetical protein n=1 Tax=Clostridium thermobutyricum TaxID=29372 RepID=UPI0018AB4D06|nr:hypothetical protein [Clostridium thermobutyricum]
MKFKGIKIDEIGLEISKYKEEINGEEAYDYFCEILENTLNRNAYLDEVTDSAIQIRFERDSNKETLDSNIEFNDILRNKVLETATDIKREYYTFKNLLDLVIK